LREKAGLTQEKLSEVTGLTYKHYQSVEAGRKPNVRITTLQRIAAAYGLEVWQLLNPEMSMQLVTEAPAKYTRPRRKPKGTG
jgi:transcriptional regulator with XRE-family HTH domain